MKFLTEEQLRELQPAETSSFPSPVPTQIVSSDEYLPVAQTAKQFLSKYLACLAHR